MKHPINLSIRSFVRLFVTLLLTALVGFAAWGSWQLYENEVVSRKFAREGKLVTVQVTATDRGNHFWYDQFTNHVYITFKHLGRSYAARYTQDSGWVSEGDKVTLLYHPQVGAFRQPGKRIHFASPFSDHSRLIDFTIASMWSDQRKWQVLGLALSTLFAILLFGMLTSIVRLPWLKWVGPSIMVVLVLTGTLYFTFNTLEYFHYYQRVKSGNQISVKVLSTDYNVRSSNSEGWSTYRATVQFGKGQRVIPIEAADYEKLRPQDLLPVIYKRELDDMMPVNYGPEFSNLIVTIFMWFLTIFLAKQYIFKEIRKVPA
ncbi:hypothetical protein [uncultured Chitinophaga sp.]|jgi:hypothetical protein|uniref:hypothetical protein n=1 Tax=uncultured Chitinophaga sp. TaxID=339340 RepID=UPI00262E56DA|nr:hypothetical protein [uncultured Chitinophaga sp.]